MLRPPNRPPCAAVGLPALDNVPWGSHLCQLYRTHDDLVAAVVPFFGAGLAHNERCVWVTPEGVPPAAAWETLHAGLPGAERHVREERLDVVERGAWHHGRGLDEADAVKAWLNQERRRLRGRFRGLRITGLAPSPRPEPRRVPEHESRLDGLLHGRRVIAVCSYALEALSSEDVLDVLRAHRFALVQRDGSWEWTEASSRQLGVEPDPDPARAGISWREAVGLMDGELSRRVASFLSGGLVRGDLAVVATGKERLAAILEACRAVGVDVNAAVARGVLLTLDLDAALDPIGGHVVVDDAWFDVVIEAPLARLAEMRRLVRVYGDVGRTASRRRPPGEALALQERWDDAVRRLPQRLIYDPASRRDRVTFRRPKPPAPVPRASRPRPGERAGRIQAVAAALADVITLEEVGQVAVAEMARISGADEALLAYRDGDGDFRVLARHPANEVSPSHSLIPSHAPIPHGRGLRAAAPIWMAACQPNVVNDFSPPHTALACMPLPLRGGGMAVLAVAFLGSREVKTAERRMIEEASGHVAAALERARLHDDLRRHHAGLEEVNRRKDEMLVTLAHELRGPLAPIMAALDIMKVRGDDASAPERALIERQIAQIRFLVEDVLDVARITRGKVDIQTERTSVAAVVARALEMANPLLRQRFHHLELDVPETLWVDADAVRLSQALANLVSNSAKYTDPGGHLRIAAARSGNEVLLTVTDDGAGIAPDMLGRVFEPFAQIARTRHRAEGGLGLGLAVVKSIVELHQGTVTARSAGEGTGSTFEVRLPVAASERRAARPPR